MGNALLHLAANEPPTRDRALLALKLRAIVAELERSSALINHETSDFIGFVDETALNAKAEAAAAAAVAAAEAAAVAAAEAAAPLLHEPNLLVEIASVLYSVGPR